VLVEAAATVEAAVGAGAIEEPAESEADTADLYVLTSPSADVEDAPETPDQESVLARSGEALTVGDQDSLSLDFDAPVVLAAVVPEPVPEGPPPMPARSRAQVIVLERMLARVHARRIEVASQYHLAS